MFEHNNRFNNFNHKGFKHISQTLNMETSICDFEKDIFDPEIRKSRKITCNETALDSGKCKFHDKNYLKTNDHQIIINEIKKKIESLKKDENS